MGLKRLLERLEHALLNLLDKVRFAYDELYDGNNKDSPVDEGFAKGIYHARLEGLREGILSGSQAQSTFSW